jgi:L-aspartate oxidase
LELAPRDVVSRAIFQEMQATGSDHVHLSLRGIDPAKVQHRFPMIYKTCLERGLDITRDNIPVAPAAHYFMGGIKSDLNAKTNIPGLLAAGECASTGVHGANRLASNSLLEGTVFGYRAAQSAKSECGIPNSSFPTPHSAFGIKSSLGEKEVQRMKLVIKSAMWNGAGIVRSAESLANARHKLEMVTKQLPETPGSVGELELRNLLLVAELITRGALERTESRGAHYRLDFPQVDDRHWQRHLVYRQG